MSNQAYILLTITFTKEEDGRWVATCDETGTSTFAKTFDQVSKEIKEMISLHLDTLGELGIREDFFRKNNIHIHYKPIKKQSIKRDVPIDPNITIQSFTQPLELCPC